MIATLLFCVYRGPEKDFSPQFFFKKMRRQILYKAYIKVFFQLRVMLF